MVGDSPFDVLSAHAAGVKAVAVSWSNVARTDLKASEPEYVIDDFSELKKICQL